MHQRGNGFGGPHGGMHNSAGKRMRGERSAPHGEAPNAWQQAPETAPHIPFSDPFPEVPPPMMPNGAGTEYGHGSRPFGTPPSPVMPPATAPRTGNAAPAGGDAFDYALDVSADIDSLLFGDHSQPGVPGSQLHGMSGNGTWTGGDARGGQDVLPTLGGTHDQHGQHGHVFGNNQSVGEPLQASLGSFGTRVPQQPQVLAPPGPHGRSGGPIATNDVAMGFRAGVPGIGANQSGGVLPEVPGSPWDGQWRPTRQSQQQHLQPNRSQPQQSHRREETRTVPTNQTRLDVGRASNTSATASVGAGKGGPENGRNLSLREISPVASALMSLGDSSRSIVGLSELIMKAEPGGTRRGSSHSTRSMSCAERVLSFRGFSHGVYPDPAILAQLSKSDVDNIAWALAVNRAGRKAEIAQRIITYLRAPLAWVLPQRRPLSGGQSPARGTLDTIPARTALRTSSTRDRLPVASGGISRSTRRPSTSTSVGASIAAQIAGSSAELGRSLRNRMINEYQAAAREARVWDFSGARRTGQRAPLFAGSSTVTSGRAGGAGGATRRREAPGSVVAASHSALLLYNFLDPENPFNLPRGGPLGASVKYQVFRTEQLNRGEEPRLSFETPAPRAPEQGVEDQIHLRCLRIEAGKQPSEWSQYWPFPAMARINGNSVELNQAQRYTSGKLAGIDTATNITPFLRKHKVGTKDDNIISLRRHASPAVAASGSFVLFAQEIRVLSAGKLRAQILERSQKHWEDHFARTRAKLNKKSTAEKAVRSAKTGDSTPETKGEGDAKREESSVRKLSDFEIAKRGVCKFMNGSDGVESAAMRVSLKCPLMLTRIKVPVKGKNCAHIQCFDLDNYLAYTRRSSKFACPVCNQPGAAPSDLLVSPYIEKALEMFTCDEVEIDPEGNMSVVEVRRTGVPSDDEDEGEHSHSNGAAAREESDTPNADGNCAADVVDLTLSDDEDNSGNSTTRGAGGVGSGGATGGPTGNGGDGGNGKGLQHLQSHHRGRVRREAYPQTATTATTVDGSRGSVSAPNGGRALAMAPGWGPGTRAPDSTALRAGASFVPSGTAGYASVAVDGRGGNTASSAATAGHVPMPWPPVAPLNASGQQPFGGGVGGVPAANTALSAANHAPVSNAFDGVPVGDFRVSCDVINLDDSD